MTAHPSPADVKFNSVTTGGRSLPMRMNAVKELATILRLIAHPDRMRILARLSQHEEDVRSLATALELPATRVSQHLSLFRAHRLVSERRIAQRRLYSVIEPHLVRWILQGLDVIECRNGPISSMDMTSLDA